jgi:hypothetical protein
MQKPKLGKSNLEVSAVGLGGTARDHSMALAIAPKQDSHGNGTILSTDPIPSCPERFSHCPHRSPAAGRATWALAEAVIRVACYLQTGTSIVVHRRSLPVPKLCLSL